MSSIQPTGTITFLFTDIEGSTRLWQAQPEAMAAALLRHDAILRDTLTAAGGHVFKTVGDAFCCAFTTADQAVGGALIVQRNLTAEPWPAEIGPLKVRVAIHTGTAEIRDGDYFGSTLNRIARILSVGYGGQILLSDATAALVRDSLPAGVSLLQLGAHRLKDLDAPETIHQLSADGLPVDFPPLRTPDSARHNLPVQATPLVGRRAQVDAVVGLLRRPDSRLITLTGVGGTGKTRLSLQVAAEVIDEYEHGVYFVDLAQVVEPEAIAPAILASLGVASPSRDNPLMILANYVAGRRMLLILDNFEQVIRGATLVSALLAAAPRLEIIVTSRELLLVEGEHEFPVPPLALPNLDRRLTPDGYLEYESVALFVGRARAVRNDFRLDEENAPAVAEICVRLDGLPLAIELAAARTRLFSPQALLARLSQRLDVLGRGLRDRPERQQTLKSTIDWSYRLLDDSEQSLFRGLGIFSGGWSIDAAEKICGPGLVTDILDGLESLLNKSLIRRMDGLGGEPRFVMLVTLGEYSRERLAESGEEAAVRRRHADYFFDFAQAANGQLRAARQLEWFDRLDAELDNLRAALGYYFEGGDAARGVAMAAALVDYWLYSYKHIEGEFWLRRAVAFADRADLAARVDALTAAALLLQYRYKIDESLALHAEAQTLAEELGDRRRLAWNSMWRGVAQFSVSDAGKMRELERAARREVEVMREIDYKPGISQGLNIVGENLRVSGDLDGAEKAYLELIPIAREIGDFRRMVFQYANLASIAYERRDPLALWQYARLGLPLSMEYRVEETVASNLIQLAVLSLWNGRDIPAARLVGAAEAWYEERSVVPQASDISVNIRMKNEVRAGMSEETFRQGWEPGRGLSLEQAVTEAKREIAVLETIPALQATGANAA